MLSNFPQSVLSLAKICPKPLYCVGGYVRDLLADLPEKKSENDDIDLCSPLPANDFITVLREAGFSVQAVYQNTGTVKFSDGVRDYEYASFRTDKYVRGTHTPVETCFTEDISLDARRRDFTCNAVYLDLKENKIVDPLNGVKAVKEKRISTVADATKVFSEDGLRLLRLARFSGSLGFTPDDATLEGAKKNASLLSDVVPERIFAELSLILRADEKYGVKTGAYDGVKVLDKTGVLDVLFPDLTAGRGLKQRSDFHDHDVLEHSLRTVLYAPPSLRLCALLHDIGKPYAFFRDGKFHEHPTEGALIVERVLTALKAPKKEVGRVSTLTRLHMYDLDCKTKENKVRRFFVENYPFISDLLDLKQADFSACKDDLSVAPTVLRWKNLLQTMRTEKAPLTLRELKIKGNDLLSVGISGKRIAETLHELLLYACCNPKENDKERLLFLAGKYAD